MGRLRLELDQPTDAAAELALDAAIDSEFNNNLRRALTVLVKEMVEMMEKDAEKTEGLSGVRAFVSVGLARFGLGRSSEIGKGGELKSREEETASWIPPRDRARLPSGLDRLGLAEREASEPDGSARRRAIPRPRRRGAGGVVAKKETDNAIYSTFITHHTPPTSKFRVPVPHPRGFRRGAHGSGAEHPTGARGADAAVKIVASLHAATATEVEVIQWAEYYFAAKELKVIFEEMDAKRAASGNRADGAPNRPRAHDHAPRFGLTGWRATRETSNAFESGGRMMK